MPRFNTFFIYIIVFGLYIAETTDMTRAVVRGIKLGPGESSSQMYYHQHRIGEHATSCINISAVNCGVVSGPV